ncbi:FlgO family outer membrane protein [Thermodesulfobacteriota bacterium]
MKKMVGLISLALLLIFTVSSAAEAFKKNKIAVLDFQMQGKEYQNTDMGSIVAEWLITALVKEGRFDVVERRLLQKILTEHQLAMSGIVDDKSISELGQILGVKIIISGAVLHFQNIIEANARIIDVSNGSIIAAESVKSTSAAGLEELVIQMAQKIIKDFPLEGYIVMRNDDKVSIDLGKRAGVKIGMQFIAYKEGKVIKHPKTGEILDIEILETGKLKITRVRENIANADITTENTPGTIKYGQMVKSVSQSSKPIGRYTTPPTTTAYGDLADFDPLIEEIRQMREANNPQWKTNYKVLFQKLKPVYAKNPTSPEVFFYYAKATAAGNDVGKANKYLAKAVHYNPKYLEAYEFQGDINYNYGRQTTSNRAKRKVAAIAQKAYESAASISHEIDYKAMMYYKIAKVNTDLSGNTMLADQYKQKAMSIAPDSEAASLAGSL